MLIKLLFVAALILFVGRSLLKMGEQSAPKPVNKKKDDEDIIDADYTVIDDDK